MNLAEQYNVVKKLASDLYGSTHTSWGQTAIGNAKIGDVIHYYGGDADATNGHWAMIIGRSGNVLTLGECNYGSRCKINWGRTLNVGSVSRYIIYSAPWAATFGSSDTVKPVISNIRVTDITRDGYTVTCDVSDNVGVTKVQFPSWNTDMHIGDDAKWLTGTISGNTATCRVNIIDLKSGLVEGHYMTHIYAYDAANNYTSLPISTVYIDRTAPVISDVSIIELDSTGYMVLCKAEDSSGIDRLQFPTWTSANGQDDLVSDWSNNDNCKGRNYRDKKEYYYFTVSKNDHNNETKGYYTHIYAYDTYGNIACCSTLTGIDIPSITMKHMYRLEECYSTDICAINFAIAGVSEEQDLKLNSVKMVTTAEVNGQEVSIEKDFGSNVILAGQGKRFIQVIDNRDLNGAKNNFKTTIYAEDSSGQKFKAFSCYNPAEYHQTTYSTMKVGEKNNIPFGSSMTTKFWDTLCGDIIEPINTETGDIKEFMALKPGRAYIVGISYGTGDTDVCVVDVIDSVTPTAKPTVTPTVEPTIKPTVKPTVRPSVNSTVKPTQKSQGDKNVTAKSTQDTYRNEVSTPGITTVESCKSYKHGKVCIKWYKVASANGYQIQYSTKKNFVRKKTKVVYGSNKLKLKLKSNKKYYVRIRAFKYGNIQYKVYGKWSSKVKVKVKK